MQTATTTRLSKFALICLLLLTGCTHIAEPAAQFKEHYLTNSALTDITSKHPENYLQLANHYLDAGNYKDATMWYYVGQIRYTAHLLVTPKHALLSEQSNFEDYQKNVGNPLIQYGGRNPEHWIAGIEQAWCWHRNNNNNFTSKEDYADIYLGIELGMKELGNYIAKNESLFRRLGNRDTSPAKSQFWTHNLSHLDK